MGSGRGLGSRQSLCAKAVLRSTGRFVSPSAAGVADWAEEPKEAEIYTSNTVGWCWLGDGRAVAVAQLFQGVQKKGGRKSAAWGRRESVGL